MTLSPDRRRFVRYTGQTPPPPGITGNCWIWTGARNKMGVPVWWQGRRKGFPHIWAWEQDNGPKPSGRQLSPRCQRSACVRPSHRQLRNRGSHIRQGVSA